MARSYIQHLILGDTILSRFVGLDSTIHEKVKKKRYEAILADPYFNALQVKYAYAVTCYKSQGGQWADVYIDQGFITEETMGSDYYRWLYTSLTRATGNVYLVNFSDKFFAGEVDS